MKKVLIAFLLFGSLYANSQEIKVGASFETAYAFFGGPFPYNTNLIVEYVPSDFFFSIQTGVNYYFGTQYIILPVILSPVYAKKFRVSPEVGFSPLIYFGDKDYGNRVDLSPQFGLRVEYLSDFRLIFFTILGAKYMPVYDEIPDKWGREPYYVKRYSLFPYLSIGMKYQLLKKE